jgi:SAM-dependent methyltransferase
LEREPIFDPTFWEDRLRNSKGEIHRAIFNGSIDQFQPLENEHKKILRECVRPEDRILDAGCGYGRLAGLLPGRWKGTYQGVDHCKKFIELAKSFYPAKYKFEVADLRRLPYGDDQFDVALVCSVKAMVVRHCGEQEWKQIEKELNRVAGRILYLTYGEWD